MVHVDVVFLHRGRAKPSTLILGGTLVQVENRYRGTANRQEAGTYPHYRRLPLRIQHNTVVHCTPYSLALTQSCIVLIQYNTVQHKL